MANDPFEALANIPRAEGWGVRFWSLDSKIKFEITFRDRRIPIPHRRIITINEAYKGTIGAIAILSRAWGMIRTVEKRERQYARQRTRQRARTSSRARQQT